MYNQIMTVTQLSKKSVNTDRHGHILYPQEFVIELLTYYKMLEYLKVADTKLKQLKLAREYQRAKNMIKLYFASEEECNARVDYSFNRGLNYFKARGFAA